MASNLSTLGFDDSDPAELELLLLRLAGLASARLATPVGDYAIWRSRSGAEVWFHLSPAVGDDGSEAREIVGLTPFFEGTSDIPLNVTEVVKRPNDTMMEGGFHAWVAPDAEGDGAYPLVFDAVDFAGSAHRSLPERWRARICGFARELNAYDDEEAFDSSQKDETKFASQSFFPVGLFGGTSSDQQGEGEHTPAPSSHALIFGEVLEFSRLVNEETSLPFYWMSVKTLAATYDIVASSAVIKGEIRVGSIVRAGCWLFGRAKT